MSNQCDLLLTDGIVVTVDDSHRIIDRGAVAISGDKIVAVDKASELSSFSAKRRIDCKGKVILPGFIDCHNHLFQVSHSSNTYK